MDNCNFSAFQPLLILSMNSSTLLLSSSSCSSSSTSLTDKPQLFHSLLTSIETLQSVVVVGWSCVVRVVVSKILFSLMAEGGGGGGIGVAVQL